MYGSNYKFQLDQLEVVSQASVTERALESYLFHESVWKEEQRGLLKMQLKTYVLKTDTDKAKIEVPTSWWQAFRFASKDKWWMKWSLKRWPVEMGTLEFPVIFPFSNMRMPEGLGRMVLLAEQTGGLHDHVFFSSTEH